MLRSNSYFIIIIFSLIFNSLDAQVNTSSPYSRFGLGELSLPGLANNLALGGTGIGSRPKSLLNYINPASFSEIDTLSFLFDFGLNGTTTNYSDAYSQGKLTNYNIHHIAIGFSVSKNWKMSLGIVPYSSVGYNISESEFLPGIGSATYNFKGSGGLNRLYLGNAVRFLKYFSAGINVNYLFGFIDYSNTVNFPYDSYAASTLIENRLNIGDLEYAAGLQYHQVFDDKYFVCAGVVFENGTSLKTSQLIQQTTTYPGSKTTIGDTIIIDPKFIINSENINASTTLPQNMGFGLSFGLKDKLTIAGDYSTQEWSKARIPGKSDTLVNSSSINVGIEYTPNYLALKGYLNKVHYRVGGYYINSYLRLKDEQLTDYGISFGVGLPMKGTRTSFNLAFILGQRGTLDRELVKENYGIVNFGLTFHDFWFFKRKFD